MIGVVLDVLQAGIPIPNECWGKICELDVNLWFAGFFVAFTLGET